MIPLSPDIIAHMWTILKKIDCKSTHGAFEGQDIVAVDIKERILESMQTQVLCEGYTDHPLMNERVD